MLGVTVPLDCGGGLEGRLGSIAPGVEGALGVTVPEEGGLLGATAREEGELGVVVFGRLGANAPVLGVEGLLGCTCWGCDPVGTKRTCRPVTQPARRRLTPATATRAAGIPLRIRSWGVLFSTANLLPFTLYG